MRPAERATTRSAAGTTVGGSGAVGSAVGPDG